jgi:hypothetical protein
VLNLAGRRLANSPSFPTDLDGTDARQAQASMLHLAPWDQTPAVSVRLIAPTGKPAKGFEARITCLARMFAYASEKGIKRQADALQRDLRRLRIQRRVIWFSAA